jgi:hypothetical protein
MSKVARESGLNFSSQTPKIETVIKGLEKIRADLVSGTEKNISSGIQEQNANRLLEAQAHGPSDNSDNRVLNVSFTSSSEVGNDLSEVSESEALSAPAMIARRTLENQHGIEAANRLLPYLKKIRESFKGDILVDMNTGLLQIIEHHKGPNGIVLIMKKVPIGEFIPIE